MGGGRRQPVLPRSRPAPTGSRDSRRVVDLLTPACGVLIGRRTSHVNQHRGCGIATNRRQKCNPRRLPVITHRRVESRYMWFAALLLALQADYTSDGMKALDEGK